MVGAVCAGRNALVAVILVEAEMMRHPDSISGPE
jgi:hypothetical protein